MLYTLWSIVTNTRHLKKAVIGGGFVIISWVGFMFQFRKTEQQVFGRFFILCTLHRTDESQIERNNLSITADFFRASIHTGSLTCLIFMQYITVSHSFVIFFYYFERFVIITAVADPTKISSDNSYRQTKGSVIVATFEKCSFSHSSERCANLIDYSTLISLSQYH